MIGIIYKATNIVNGKVYIGQTSRSLEERRKEHESIAKETTWKTEGFFYGAIALFGIDKFSWEVLETVETDGNETDLRYLLLEAERKQIEAHKSYDRRFGYNVIGNPDGYLADMYCANHGNPKGPVVAYDVFSAEQVGEYPSLLQLRLALGTHLVHPKILSSYNLPKHLIVGCRVKYVAFYKNQAYRVSEYLRKHLAINIGAGRLVWPGKEQSSTK